MNKPDPRGPDWRRANSGSQCGWPGCEEFIAGRLWGCREHWMMVPMDLRDAWMAAGQGRSGPKGRPVYERPAAKLVNYAIREWISEKILKEDDAA